jgi:hypothetical protein
MHGGSEQMSQVGCICCSSLVSLLYMVFIIMNLSRHIFSTNMVRIGENSSFWYNSIWLYICVGIYMIIVFGDVFPTASNPHGFFLKEGVGEVKSEQLDFCYHHKKIINLQRTK